MPVCVCTVILKYICIKLCHYNDLVSKLTIPVLHMKKLKPRMVNLAVTQQENGGGRVYNQIWLT